MLNLPRMKEQDSSSLMVRNFWNNVSKQLNKSYNKGLVMFQRYFNAEVLHIISSL